MKNFLVSFLALLPFGRACGAPVEGEASYYSDHYEGRTMANGEPYRHMGRTIATWEFPLGTKVRITYRSRSGKERVAYATVTDRGPARWVQREKPHRKFDFSISVFKRLESLHAGVIWVKVEEVR